MRRMSIQKRTGRSLSSNTSGSAKINNITAALPVMGGAVFLYRGEGMFSTPVTAGGFWYMTGKIGHADAEGNNFCAFCAMI